MHKSDIQGDKEREHLACLEAGGDKERKHNRTSGERAKQDWPKRGRECGCEQRGR